MLLGVSVSTNSVTNTPNTTLACSSIAPHRSHQLRPPMLVPNSSTGVSTSAN